MTRTEYERRQQALLRRRDRSLRALKAQGRTLEQVAEMTGFSLRLVADVCAVRRLGPPVRR